MHLHLTTLLFIILEHINKIFTQGIPISPCPKMFQYRFDGTEWFGLLSVRNPDFGQPLHLRVTLSIRGKPTTNYLGEIELLTRGQFLSDSPVLYKVKFPKHHFPPKLLQITTNNQVVCLGAADHSIFVTQIQLEHTRKLTFISDGEMAIPLTPGFMPATSTKTIKAGTTGGTIKESSLLLPTNHAFGTKHFPLSKFEKNPTPIRTTKDICGTIDQRIRFQVLHSIKFPAGYKPAAVDVGGVNLNTAGDILAKGDDIDIGANPQIMPTFVDDIADESNSGAASDSSFSGSVLTNDEQPSITRGAWPWLAAIYVNNLTSLTYQCGGTLVSARVVISSAHCFQLFKQRYTANEVLVFLGRHNLKNWNEEGSLAAPVDDIFIHPDYDQHLSNYDADIAVIMLKNEVRFSTFIRPACMWSGSTKSQYIEGEHGVVVAWGLGGMNATTAATMKSTVPRIVHAPIVSNAACFRANDKFRSLSSNRTFCAGIVTPTTSSSSSSSTSAKYPSSGPCSGDSGAGLMIFKNNRWLLRGTVSASLPVQQTAKSDSGSQSSPLNARSNSQSRCNVNQYVIYTDVAKFLDWIFAFII